jgi:hypothetical protein
VDIVNELKAELDEEFRARDHSLRYVGAIVLRLWDDLERQDVEVGSGRAGRSTPLGTLLHDAGAPIHNYQRRSVEIERLRAAIREARGRPDGVARAR